MLERSSGILLPMSSLPSKYGIGTFGKESYNFIDFLYESGQKYWQVLPLGPVSFGDSPYQSFSVYAGNPYYIDFEIFIDDGLIKFDDCRILEEETKYVDYEKLFNERYDILKKAYDNSKGKYELEICNFREENKDWIEDYALFMALKYENNQLPWYEWEYAIANRENEALNLRRNRVKREIDYWVFLQFLFYKQYFKLKSYANKKGVKIIGDIPIYVAEDSCDAWTNKKLFLNLEAGVPPDSFSSTGQLWGNPVYDWDYLEKTNYKWWIDRIAWSAKMYDAVRIDHFRGFDEFWAVPKGSLNAINGKWYKAKGKEMFAALRNILEHVNIIAEDLGIITDSVTNFREETGYPGMKVLQFAFDGNPANPYLPNNFEENCVAYTGTHDNDTLRGWWESLSYDEKEHVSKILGFDLREDDNPCYSIIKSLYNSKAKLCIIPLQDYMCLGSESRINTPSTLGDNWRFRVNRNLLTDSLSNKIKNMVVESNRISEG